METVLQIVFLVVVFSCFTVVFSILGGIRSREENGGWSGGIGGYQPKKTDGDIISPPGNPDYKPREPEKHIREAQIARAILSGCTAAEVQRHFTGYSEEAFLSKSKIYTITRNICKKCACHPVESNVTMTELRHYKDKFLPMIEEYLEIYGPGRFIVMSEKDAKNWDPKAGEYFTPAGGAKGGPGK